MNPETSHADRRTLIGAAAAAGLLAMIPGGVQAAALAGYGQINKMSAKPGMRDQLIKTLPEAVRSAPECLGYIISADVKDPEVLWAVELWTSEAGHAQAMTQPRVKDGVTLARTMLAKFEPIAAFTPAGGGVS